MAVHLRQLKPGDAGWVIQRHAEDYTRLYGFSPGFEAVVARVLADIIDSPAPDMERGWIADGAAARRTGCIFCSSIDSETAQLRLFFVEPQERRAGLGRRLLWACIAHAQQKGFRWLKLWTHAEQEAACALYRRAGFVVTQEEQRMSFGVRARVQTHVLDLSQSATTRSALLQ